MNIIESGDWVRYLATGMWIGQGHYAGKIFRVLKTRNGFLYPYDPAWPIMNDHLDKFELVAKAPKVPLRIGDRVIYTGTRHDGTPAGNRSPHMVNGVAGWDVGTIFTVKDIDYKPFGLPDDFLHPVEVQGNDYLDAFSLLARPDANGTMAEIGRPLDDAEKATLPDTRMTLSGKPLVCTDHSWKEYEGFTERFEYCIHCDKKKV